MMKCSVNIGKVALLLCNFLFLLSGFCLILIGCVVLNDPPRILLSNLALEPGTLPQPLLYYVALGFVTAGIVVSTIAILGCWTSLGPDSDCLMAVYIFFLAVLLLLEISTGVIGTFCPQAFGAGMDRDQMVASLMNNYGVPGRDQYTAAVDLAQTIFECCGMQSGSDYDGSRWWKREQESNHDLRVPRSCCFLQNTNNKNAFLDPVPVNITLCQAKNNARYQLGRHVKGCIDPLNNWFREHITIFLIIGLALIIVQLSVLLCAIIFCMRRKKGSTLSRDSEVSSERSTTTNVPKQKLQSENDVEPKAEGKNRNGGRLHENGFPVLSSRDNQTGKQTNSKRTNYSFRNFNFMDSEDCLNAKRNDSGISSPFVSNLDENRNNPRTYTNTYQGAKYHQEQRNRQYPFYTHKMQPSHNSYNENEMQYEAMRHYFRKNNDVSTANNSRDDGELGT